MINDRQIALVQSSFEQVLPIADEAGVLLYERIFTLLPEARGLFADDIRPQAHRLMAAVKLAVDGLGQLDSVAPYLIKLGARHAQYGMKPEYFEVGGAALMWTLEQGLGDAFTPETRDAWAAAWNVVASAMLTGMLEAELAAGTTLAPVPV
ncbi:MAG TPA: globin domain-containing protein [Acidimicrobiales bacterium]|nr:globin domain-containing protein [Acidimicrobiales bacterium]